MILQALTEYYENRPKVRSLKENDQGLPDKYLSIENISFAVVISKQGELKSIIDLREPDSKGKSRPIGLIVPESVIGKAGKTILPNFLWENSSYMLGFDNKGKPERTAEKFSGFLELHKTVHKYCPENKSLSAIVHFLQNWEIKDAEKNITSEIKGRLDEKDFLTGNIVFMISSSHGTSFIHEEDEIYQAWVKYRLANVEKRTGMCLVDGKITSIARLHHLLSGVDGTQSFGAAIVSFNLNSFESYGKIQNSNAPVGEIAAFSYTTSLNRLLMRGSRQRIKIGDTTTVFWTERPSPIENIFGLIMDPHETEGADVKPVAYYLKAIRAGKKPSDIKDDSIKFYILGLAPNASRIAVRFWYADTVEALNRHIGEHFKALSLVRNFDNEKEFPGIWQLLIETATLHKSENINPLLSGAMMRSILTGGKYPVSILSAIVGRIHADHNINYYRATLIKAVLVRNFGKEVSMSLSEESTNIAYRLGRLFAVLEKVQEEAIPGANATIKDRFFGAASTTPRTVFPQLIRLSQHHFSKLEGGAKIYKEQLVQSIINGINGKDGFPAFLKLDDQGMFALGYYHQRKAFFTKKEKATEEIEKE
ncbi:MAG: type I-C CRISPR-associated protein Cas8c/Csd1 [Spirochaetales bacterium]|nr:type I-C CRISPR-associated protein Cas8c/Csd1 [Spirochaetales bacterium]